MAARVCLVHYHEVGLKGKNRAHFEHILMDNIKAALAAFSVNAVSRISGYILVTFNEHQADDAARVIRTVPGVARVSLAYHTNRDPQEYCAAAVKALREFGSFDSFKVHAKRSNTDYELTSIDINRQVGEVLCEAFPDKKVQMHDPDAMVHVLVVQGSVYVYARSERGVGGLPVGSAGKVVTLLSSGIDSPVATWMLARRGAVCVPVHFSGRPQTPDTSEYLVQDIIRALEPGVQIGRLYVVPFGDCQREISVTCPSNLRVIMYRRIMYSVAERIAHIEGAKAIVTGESLGQVASQTLENIMAVNEAVKIPVFRPLIGSDKQEIIARATQCKPDDRYATPAELCAALEQYDAEQRRSVPTAQEMFNKPEQELSEVERMMLDILAEEAAAYAAGANEGLLLAFSRLAGLFRVCARLFSQQLQRALPDRDLDVQLLLLPPLPFDVDVQFVQTGLQARESGLHGRQHVRRIRRVPRPGCGRRHVSRRHRRHAGFPLPGRRGLPPGCLRHGRLLGSGEHPSFPVSRRRTPPRPVRRRHRVIPTFRTRPRPPPRVSAPQAPARAPACVGRARARRSTP